MAKQDFGSVRMSANEAKIEELNKKVSMLQGELNGYKHFYQSLFVPRKLISAVKVFMRMYVALSM